MLDIEKKVEKELWKEWFSKKNKKTELALFLFYKKWVHDLYRRVIYRSGENSYYQEFLPDAEIGLLKSIRTFKRNRNASFKTYAAKLTQNEVYRALYPFFKGGRQRPGTFNFVGDVYSHWFLRDVIEHDDFSEEKVILKEILNKIKMKVIEWGYTRKEWKCFYYRKFRFVPILDICKKVNLSERRVNQIISFIRKDLESEFGDEYKSILKNKYDNK